MHSLKGIKYLNNRARAPATTGDATLVPDNERHPPLELKCKYNLNFFHEN